MSFGVESRVVNWGMSETLSVSRFIAASVEEVYAAISDVVRMGEWSEECYACVWQDGWSGPEVGAVFDGHNRFGDHEWVTQGRVTEAVPGRAFVFECSFRGHHFSTWGYRIQAAEGGCLVEEWTTDLTSDEAKAYARRTSGIDDRAARNRETMTGTLDRLAAALEASGH